MPSFRTSRRVPFTARQMFDVVADVERYPEFLPLCEGLTVLTRTEGPSSTVLTATMVVGYRAITERFTTRVLLEPGASRILVSHLDGPFSRLENEWRFVPVAGGSEVQFAIDYVFRSAMLSLLVGAAFDTAVRNYAEAFEQRARQLYGSRAGSSPGA